MSCLKLKLELESYTESCGGWDEDGPPQAQRFQYLVSVGVTVGGELGGVWFCWGRCVTRCGL